MSKSKHFRVLAISFSSRGFGYAVMERGQMLVDYGNKVVTQDKNVHSLAQIEKVVARNQPDILVLQDVNAKGAHRAERIKALHRRVVDLAKRRKLRTVTISGQELRSALLGNANGTKHEIAQLITKCFPDELASRLPAKRKPWNSEDARMDIFDAVALVSVLRMKWK